MEEICASNVMKSQEAMISNSDPSYLDLPPLNLRKPVPKQTSLGNPLDKFGTSAGRMLFLFLEMQVRIWHVFQTLLIGRAFMLFSINFRASLFIDNNFGVPSGNLT